MDLNEFLPKSEEIVVDIVDPKTEGTDEPKKTGMSVTIHAPHSKAFKEVQYRFIDEALERNSVEGDKPKISSKDIEQNRIRQSAAITKGWNLVLDGTKIKFSENKALEIYEKFPFIVRQIEEAVSQAEVFT